MLYACLLRCFEVLNTTTATTTTPAAMPHTCCHTHYLPTFVPTFTLHCHADTVSHSDHIDNHDHGRMLHVIHSSLLDSWCMAEIWYCLNSLVILTCVKHMEWKRFITNCISTHKNCEILSLFTFMPLKLYFFLIVLVLLGCIL